MIFLLDFVPVTATSREIFTRRRFRPVKYVCFHYHPIVSVLSLCNDMLFYMVNINFVTASEPRPLSCQTQVQHSDYSSRLYLFVDICTVSQT